MCPDVKAPYKEDAAQALSDLLSHNGFTAGLLRTLIRENWPRLAQLAHQIHVEETSPSVKLNRAAKIVAALNERGIMDVVYDMGGSDAVASFKLLAEEALRPKVC